MLTYTGENVQKGTRISSTRCWVILVARTRRKKKGEENSVSTFGRFRLWTSFESSPVPVTLDCRIRKICLDSSALFLHTLRSRHNYNFDVLIKAESYFEIVHILLRIHVKVSIRWWSVQLATLNLSSVDYSLSTQNIKSAWASLYFYTRLTWTAIELKSEINIVFSKK